MLSTRDSFSMERHKKFEKERMKTDISCKQYPKESWGGYSNIRHSRL